MEIFPEEPTPNDLSRTTPFSDINSTLFDDDLLREYFRNKEDRYNPFSFTETRVCSSIDDLAMAMLEKDRERGGGTYRTLKFLDKHNISMDPDMAEDFEDKAMLVLFYLPSAQRLIQAFRCLN